MRPTSLRLFVFVGLTVLAFVIPGCVGTEPDAVEADGRLRVTLPPVVLRGVPVDSVLIESLTPEGDVDTEFNGTAAVTGLRILRTVDGETVTETPETVTLESGVAEYATQLARGERVYVTTEFSVSADDESVGADSVMVAGFWSLLPPVVAIVLAIWLKDVYVALLAAVYSGALVLAGWNPWAAFTNILDPEQTGILAQASDSWNMQLIMFTLFLGAMIQVMARSGGTQAVVHRLSRFTSTRERGQVLTWFMGLLVFFDDYANTMLVGGAMRPVTDRLKVSREKLAFLIDSTAAPIAGLAIVSTWVGVEVGYIGDGFESLGMEKNISYAVFLKTIPYRFYPMFLIGFVMLIAATGRDYGPMLRAERDCQAAPRRDAGGSGSPEPVSGSVWYAIAPVGLLVAWIGVGFVSAIQGDGSMFDRTVTAVRNLFSGEALSFGDDFDSVPLLLHASMAAALLACVLSVGGRALNIRECADAWVKGMTDMFPAIVVLVLAWSVSSICKPGGLNTAGYIIETIGDGVAPQLMPTLAFIISGAVAFAIGSSYTTMGLLIPLFMSLVGYLLAASGVAVSSDDPLMLSSIGAILAGSIFGDHCSPISDTTVLSSAGAQCDHLRHVSTQLPYALTVGAVAVVCGYLPAGYGMNPWLMLLVGFVACVVIVRVFGRRPEPVNPS